MQIIWFGRPYVYPSVYTSDMRGDMPERAPHSTCFFLCSELASFRRARVSYPALLQYKYERYPLNIFLIFKLFFRL